VKKNDKNHVLQIVVRDNIHYLALESEVSRFTLLALVRVNSYKQEEAHLWMLAIDGIKPKQAFTVIAPEERVCTICKVKML